VRPGSTPSASRAGAPDLGRPSVSRPAPNPPRPIPRRKGASVKPNRSVLLIVGVPPSRDWCHSPPAPTRSPPRPAWVTQAWPLIRSTTVRRVIG